MTRLVLRAYEAGASRFQAMVGQASASRRVLPEFLILGAQRAGTATLYYTLCRHPSVLPARRKEIHFFDVRHRRGLRWYRGHFPTAAQMQSVRRATGTALTGEASPYYLFHPAVPARVQTVLPDVRLVALLRDPVDRAYSHYQWEVGKGREHLTFEEALAAEPARLAGEEQHLLKDDDYVSDTHRHQSYLARGLYLQQLENWWRQVPRGRLLVIESEEFFSTPGAVLERVEQFLGLPPWHPVDGFVRRNAGHYAGLDTGLRRRLEDYFAPHTAALETALGMRFSWGRR
ncbi:MAG TPA: sulfotransferase domain-containing protein [bacterium]